MTTKDRNLYLFYQRMLEMGFTLAEADTLRKAERTLHRWHELECGDGNDHCSWAIERGHRTPKGFEHDENGKPYLLRYWHDGKVTNERLSDREKGARNRIDKIMSAHTDYVAYIQGDPRGCALYIVARKDVREGESLDSVYTRGFGVAA